MLNTSGRVTEQYTGHGNYTCNDADQLGLYVEITLVSHVFCSSELSERLTGPASRRSVEEHTLTYMTGTLAHSLKGRIPAHFSCSRDFG